MMPTERQAQHNYRWILTFMIYQVLIGGEGFQTQNWAFHL